MNYINIIEQHRNEIQFFESRSPIKYFHIAFFIDKNGECLAMDVNSELTMGSIHAEVNALNKLKKKILARGYRKRENFDLMVLRVSPKGKLCSSKPCLHCTTYLINTPINIKNIFYSTTEGTMKKERLSKINRDTLTICLSRRKKI